MKDADSARSHGSVSPSAPPDAPIDSEALFKMYARFVASFLFRLGARGADLDDAVQDVFLAAHRKGGYRPGAASPTTFLAQLALEANLKRRRGDGRRQTARSDQAALATIGAAPPDPSQALATKEAATRLQGALDAMDAGHRAVFILFELEGESCDAIAAGLGLPTGTVYSRLHAARRVFRESAARAERGDERAPPRSIRGVFMGVKEPA